MVADDVVNVQENRKLNWFLNDDCLLRYPVKEDTFSKSFDLGGMDLLLQFC